MVTGVLGAVAQTEVRRILSFHIISQIGYMVMGLGMLTPLALGGAIFYIIHHIIVKTNLFLISGMVLHLRGTHQLKNLGGLYRAYPGVSFLFLIPALSLAGLPPLSGFFAKLALVRAGLETGQFAIVAVALGVSLLTLFSMMKIWNEAFWKPSGEDDPPPTRSVPTALWLPTAGLALLTILVGLAAGPLLVFSMRAAEQLLGM
jgi:multicomponent Na+:H+ antiporter subunit D